MADFDELEPRQRPTDPAPAMTDREMLLDLSEQVASLAALVREIHTETAGLTRAFHDVNGHLTAIRADSYMASEQLQPIGTQLGELAARVARLESQRKSSFPPGSGV